MLTTSLLLVSLLLPGCTNTADDADGDGSPASEDCDDKNAAVYPGAEEICDELDNDCDGETDPTITAYPDADGDGFGDAAGVVTACAVPEEYISDATDCDDTDAAVHPGADESDCTSTVDFNCDGTPAFVDGDGDGSPSCTDCDDADATRFPGALEVCDAVDNDCNDLVDDDATDGSTWYADEDGDGYGTDVVGVACTAPPDSAGLTGDCDDDDPLAHPDAIEVCGGADDDCDGLVDDDDPDVVGTTSFYTDADGDGFGAAAGLVSACEQPANTTTTADDCDDTNPFINPDGTEACSPGDDDCDGLVDDADDSLSGGPAWFTDADGDTYGDVASAVTACLQPAGTVAAGGDCNDADAAINPAATEVCAAGDEDCDGVLGDADTSTADKTTWYPDADTDGHGNAALPLQLCTAGPGMVAVGDDCDDTKPGVNPEATEICNGVDDNCDGLLDDADTTVTGEASWYQDVDGDTYGDIRTLLTQCSPPSGYVSTFGDCNDADAAINPAATEVCGGSDENCDGLANDADPAVSDKATWYRDGDGDTYGTSAISITACVAGSGFVSDATDCNDGDAATNPGATEVCGGGDEDCDGTANDADSSVTGTVDWYHDGDGDTYGDAASTITRCTAGPGFVADSTDCDDVNGAINPGATEICGGGDNNCDGLADDADPGVDPATLSTWYLDADHDGYGGSSSLDRCAPGPGHIATGGDCLDTAPSINPGAGESCVTVGVDDDCDSIIDAADTDLYDGTWYYPDRDGDGIGKASEGAAYCGSPGSRYSEVTDDCDDTDDTVWSGCTEPTFTESFDVVVVGSGPSGIAAALSAREMGATVVIFERSADAGTGIVATTTLLAVGTSWQTSAGVTDSVDSMVADWTDLTGVSGDTTAVRDYLSATPELLSWLESYGVTIDGVETGDDMGSLPRAHTIVAADGDVPRLLPEFDGELRTEVQIDGPVMWGDEVVGVRWTDKVTGATGTTGAGAVILATGGYQRDPGLLASSLPGLSSRDWVYESIIEANGGGVPFVNLVGSARVNANAVGLYADATRDFGSPGPHEALLYSAPGNAILVGVDGARFEDEDLVSSLSFAETMPDGDVWLIADADRAASLTLSRVFYNRSGGTYEFTLDDLPSLSSDAWYADTVGELATLIGVDETGLQTELDAWNEAEATGAMDSFGRVPADHGPIVGPGYYALRVYVGVARAFGGVATDTTTEVLDGDDVPIPGLYAAGEVAGMVPGGGSGAGFGGSGSACYYGGRVAGQEAATYAASR